MLDELRRTSVGGDRDPPRVLLDVAVPSGATSCAARASSAGSCATTEPLAAHPLLELVGRPAGDDLPLSTTAIESVSLSASSRYWVVSSTVAPARTCSSMTSHRLCRLRGSSPVVGSSRKITGGCATSAPARSRRRRIPPE